MNFLALVQDVARQSGTLAGGVTLASVANPSGRADKIVNFVQSAWEDIQNQRQWSWLRAGFSHSLLADTTTYTAASFDLTRFGNWFEDADEFRAMTIYDPDIGQSDESELSQIPYEQWKVKYDRRSHDANRPIEWAISPASEFCVGPKPDQTYTLRGEYWKSPQALAENDDTPESPSRYHKAIVWRAMQIAAENDEAVTSLAMANTEYSKLFWNMVNDRQCLDQFSLVAAGPLA